MQTYKLKMHVRSQGVSGLQVKTGASGTSGPAKALCRTVTRGIWLTHKKTGAPGQDDVQQRRH